MTNSLDGVSWSLDALGQAMEALARRSGLAPRSVQTGGIPLTVDPSDLSGEAISDWIGAAALWLGFEAQEKPVVCGSLDEWLRLRPTLLRLPGQGRPAFLAILGRQKKTLRLLTPSLAVVPIPVAVVEHELLREFEEPVARAVNQLLCEAGMDGARHLRVRAGMVRLQLQSRRIGTFWHLSSLPGSSFWRQCCRIRLPQNLATLIAASAVEYALWILSWWLVGKGALAGRFDRGWLLGWALLLLTIVPFRLLQSWLQGVVSIGAGGLLKQRLLSGALRLVPEEIRHQGIGQFLGQVIESEAVESLALSGGFLVLLAAVELAAAAFVVAWGAAGSVEVLLLLGWIAVTLALAWWYFQRRYAWARSRLGMTQDLIERMVGHRTRLTQLPRERWHDGEDEALERYLEVSQGMGRAAVKLMSLVPRGWMLLAIVGLAPVFVVGRVSAAALAVALGGILLAYNAFRRLVSGLGNLADALISWKQVEALFHAAARPEQVGPPLFALTSPPSEESPRLIEAQGLRFRYPDRAEPVLDGCSLSVCAGDRVLLEGPSGGGKSTLASLLTGLRSPQSGLLLLRGLDRQTLGDQGWRRRMVAAPQFHENHVLTETFAFNLLMGRRWPPREEDLREAEVVCRELGLDDLLERMPAGLLQMVGETGWQLSHGERSLMFIARALLQRADMMILDESFAALDPETLERSLECVLRRAPALMVIAHP